MADKQEKYFQISSTLDKYTRISKNTGNISENEIRVKSSKETKFYVGYALHMLEKSNSESITIKATGNAIPKAVNVVEILKRRVENLHQINAVRNVEVEDTYEPLEEGLDTVVVKRYLSLIEITLTKKLDQKQKNEPGYQEPLPAHELNTVHNQAFRTQVNTNINKYRGGGGYGGQSRPRIQPSSHPNENYRNEGYNQHQGGRNYPNENYRNEGYNQHQGGRSHTNDNFRSEGNNQHQGGRSDSRNNNPNDRGYGASDYGYSHGQRQGFQSTRGKAPTHGHHNNDYPQPQRGARRTRGGGDVGGSRRNHNSDQDFEYQPKAPIQQQPRQRIGNN